jgi:hypothetical protein
MSTAPKTKRAGHLRHTPVLIATVAVASIVLLLKPASAAGLRSTSDWHAASRQTRTSAPAHTKSPRAARGHYLPDSLGNATITYTPYLTPGTHWIAAELSNSDPTSLRPRVRRDAEAAGVRGVPTLRTAEGETHWGMGGLQQFLADEPLVPRR